jgi:Pyridoxamine 5'-phosphate oxidase
LDEAWEAVGAAHTGILTTLRRDGGPIALPVWFVVDDRTVAMMTDNAGIAMPES